MKVGAVTFDSFDQSRLRVGCCTSDAATRHVLEAALVRAGHHVTHADSGVDAILRFATDPNVEVLVLDVDLADMDGRDLCRALRASGQRAPTMFLNASGQVHDVLQAFAAGGLDHLVKPFAVPEFLARVEALGRRSRPSTSAHALSMDPQSLTLVSGDASVPLTPTEFRIAAELFANAGRLVPRSAIVISGWSPGAYVHQNTLDTYMYRIRRHLKAVGSPASIQTVRGIGYTARGVA